MPDIDSHESPPACGIAGTARIWAEVMMCGLKPLLSCLCLAGWVIQSPAQVVAGGEFERYAASHPGDAARGKSRFEADSSRCAMCHSVDGSASKLGPDLGSIGDKFERRDLIKAVLNPAAEVAVGYGMTTVETRSSGTLVGVVKSASPETMELTTVDGASHRIAMDDVKSQNTLDVTLMPNGFHEAMGPDGFADLIAYLGSLHAKADNGIPGSPAVIPAASHRAEFETIFNGPFDHPVWFGWIPGRGTKAGIVLEHGGRMWSVDRTGSGEEKKLLLDLTKVVRRGGATGLLGLAFHPGYQKNRRYFLKYQVQEEGVISTIIDERKMLPDRDEDSGAGPRQIIKIRSVTQDHNGGSVEFGPDGFLYFAMGDTGPQRDPQGHGQDLGTLLAKMCRIDVDHQDEGLAYAIPKDNPFVGKTGARPEIWAYGLREPFRFCWDSANGDLWVGDVGQDRYEEVSIIRRGENMGWNIFEGHHPFSDRFRRGGENYVSPVMTYSHRAGVSVTGGQVYRGTKAPDLAGWYVFGDFESRRVWALRQKDRKLSEVVEICRAPSRIPVFSRDTDGEIYLAGYDDGVIRRLVLDDVDTRPLETKVLAESSERAPMKWRFNTARPDDSWTAENHDDSRWNLAPGGFGTEGTPGAVVHTAWSSSDIWLRRAFDVTPDLASASGDLILRLHHDEDVEVYLNGERVLRRPGWTQGYVDERIDGTTSLKPGRNVLAIHCHQNGGGQFIDAGLLKALRR